jgi:predicted nucleotidyltransferase
MIPVQTIEPPNQVLSLRLFGSEARCDSDLGSDLDILAVLDSPLTSEIATTVTAAVEALFQRNASISWYSKERVIEMYRAGHLFAWHLYLESAPLTPGYRYDILKILGNPVEYTCAEEDINSLIDILHSVPSALKKCPNNSCYEAGIIFVCLRNIALSASSLSADGLDFSRYSPYNIADTIGIPFPLNTEEYRSLIHCRLCSQRGMPYVGLKYREVISLYGKAWTWAQQIKLFVKEAKDGNSN